MRSPFRKPAACAASMFVVLALCVPSSEVNAAEPFLSHPPLRTAPQHPARPLPTGPAYFVDPTKGDDRGDGSEKAPWRTIRHAVRQLAAGDTLMLRDGVYRETVTISLEGRPDAPIIIRGYPGEQAIVDGSFAEFFDSPATAWKPAEGANGPKDTGAFVSTNRYPNLRDVVGWFGDSMIGLQTYYHEQDLVATNELADFVDPADTATSDLKPLWCGPGLWYNRATGRIHCRLSHTTLPKPVVNYAGETDPRKLPLVVAPFDAVPLRLERANHVRIQDLTLRGAGYRSSVIEYCKHVELDHVTIWCGTYGALVNATEDLTIRHCAFHGSLAPWTFRGDASKRDYPGRPHRNISRLNTHAHIEIESGGESSVFATPQNDRFEIAHCEFTDAHDGPYLGGINVRFHHNLIENLQDDGIYLSPMYLRHRLDKTDPKIVITQNLFRGMLTALAFGGTQTTTNDRITIARNVFDLRFPILTGRPSSQRPAAGVSRGKLMGDHGSPPWPSMTIVHNTVVAVDGSRDAEMAATASNVAQNPRRVFNNVFVHLGRLPGYVGADASKDAASDANLIWSAEGDIPIAEAYFGRFRKSPAFEQSKAIHAAGTSSNSLAANPRFSALSSDATAKNDYRLQGGSPAIDAGIPLADDVIDPLRDQDAGRPDLGALPLGIEPWGVGIDGRVKLAP